MARRGAFNKKTEDGGPDHQTERYVVLPVLRLRSRLRIPSCSEKVEKGLPLCRGHTSGSLHQFSTLLKISATAQPTGLFRCRVMQSPVLLSRRFRWIAGLHPPCRSCFWFFKRPHHCEHPARAASGPDEQRKAERVLGGIQETHEEGETTALRFFSLLKSPQVSSLLPFFHCLMWRDTDTCFCPGKNVGVRGSRSSSSLLAKASWRSTTELALIWRI